MEKIFNFGKVDGYGNGRKSCAVEVRISLEKNKNNKLLFAASARLWNSKHTDTICGGQCLDTLYNGFRKLRNNELFVKIYGLWKRNHLNDMHAGTIKQEELVEKYKKEVGKYDYTKVCNYLEENNLLIDNGYKYGTSWLYREISKEDLDTIYELLGEKVE